MTPHQLEVILDAYASGEGSLWLKRSDVIDRMEAAGYLDGYHVTPAGAEAAGVPWADFLDRLHGDALIDAADLYPAHEEVERLRLQFNRLPSSVSPVIVDTMRRRLDIIEAALRAAT
ncbi:hypothetical protein [Dactylosporangium sp. CA-139066]|uniref:hypothetical protein n=1 Tax=Dactylosporangium sp. CA-139066 TaxID=3239930 RepID=UPI003D8BFF22